MTSIRGRCQTCLARIATRGSAPAASCFLAKLPIDVNIARAVRGRTGIEARRMTGPVGSRGLSRYNAPARLSYPSNSCVGRRSSIPSHGRKRSVAWLQRVCATSGWSLGLGFTRHTWALLIGESIVIRIGHRGKRCAEDIARIQDPAPTHLLATRAGVTESKLSAKPGKIAQETSTQYFYRPFSG